MTDGPMIELERRITRLEGYMDARIVTRDLFEVHMATINQRLEKGEDNATWLMRFMVLSLVGTIINGAFFLLR